LRFFSANTESSSSGPYIGIIGGLVAVIIMLIITIVTLLSKRNEGNMFILLMWTPIGDIMVNVLASSAIDRGFEFRSSQTITMKMVFVSSINEKEQRANVTNGPKFCESAWRFSFFQHTLLIFVFCCFLFCFVY
jgi:hypothetical protein